MDLELNGKTALVTGSTGGIGLAIAKSLAREGAAVTINGRTQQRVDEAMADIELESPGADVGAVAADLSTELGAAQLFGELPEFDILVNNLGVYGAKDFFQIHDSEWLDIFNTNVMSGVRLSRHYLRGMLLRNWGRIVFISSESAVNTPVEMIHYGMTKTAQLALSRGLAELTAGTGVTVNAMLVGPTRSEGVEQFVAGLAKDKGVEPAEVERQFFRETRPTSLLKRFETPEEIAVAVAFVCSPLAAAINGAPLRIDGGVVRSAF